MIRQLEPNPDPILPSQLATEVKAIYAGLVMVEQKCIEVVRAQTLEANGGRTLTKNQWQALIALHKTLLNEHHDFFLASQHPAASQPLKRLPAKYTMPARMWRNGIHSFLELLRHSLPGSLEHMLTFIYIAYSTITLLYETVPEYKDTWIECLGDLGRYRMAIEDENMRDRDIWTGVARDWYTMASNSSPAVGRLYHHLAILARPHPVQQLSYYAKSVCVSLPFPSARDSANAFIAPHLTTPPGPHARVTVCEGAFIRCHGVIFTGSSQHRFDSSLEEFRLHLDKHITTYNVKSAEQGCQMAIANTCALMGFGSEGNAITRVLRARGRDEIDPESAAKDADQSSIILDRAIRLNYATNLVTLKRTGDINVLPYLHIVLAFMLHLSDSPLLFDTVERAMPWHALASTLNFLLDTHKMSRHETESFLRAPKGDSIPLPEDWFLRGFAWGDKYLPEGWFDRELAEADDGLRFLPHALTKPSVNADRQERILWIGARMAQSTNTPLTYDHEKHRFDSKEKIINCVDGSLFKMSISV
jgi:hypothetical protein